MEPLMVEASAAGDAAVIPGALLMGVCMGALYDGFRILHMALGLRSVSGVGTLSRKLVSYPVRRVRTSAAGSETGAGDAVPEHTGTRRPGKAVLLFFLDILYFLLAAVCAVLFIYRENAGMLRWYLPASMALGFAAWYLSAGKAVMRTAAVLLGLLRASVVFFYNHTVFFAVMILYRAGSAWKRLLLRGCSAVRTRCRTRLDGRRRRCLAARTDRNCRAAEAYFTILDPIGEVTDRDTV